MRVAEMTEILIQTGRLLTHLRGAWRCVVRLVVIVEAEAGVDDVVEDVMDAGLGL